MRKLIWLLLLGLLAMPILAAQAQQDTIETSSVILFTSEREGNLEVFVMDADGGNQRNLTNDRGSDYTPRWSPDGTQIVFGSDRSGDPELYVMDADGNNLRRLTDSPGVDRSPAWSPDGSRIAFMSSRDGNWEIYVMNTDGSNPQNLTNSGFVDASPTWMPVTQQITFTSNRDGNPEVYMMNADGTNVLRLTNNPTLDDQPSWSPDGTRLAVISQRDEGLGIYLLDRNGLNPQFVITNLIADAPVSWSADGQQLVFQSTSGPEDQDIFSVRIDGSDLEQLTEADGWDQNPNWKPDPELSPAFAASSVIPTSTAAPTVDPNASVFATPLPDAAATQPVTQATVVPTAPANVDCTLFAFHNVVKRVEPNFTAAQSGSVPAENRVRAVAQAVDTDGKIWWQLEDGLWVFSEVINERGNCNALPLGDVG